MKDDFLLITKVEWARMAELANQSPILTPADGKMWKNVKSRGDPFKLLKECIELEIKYAGVFRHAIDENFNSLESIDKLKMKMKEMQNEL